MNSKIDLTTVKERIALESGRYAILVDTLGKVEDYTSIERARNVYLVSPSGEIVWRIFSQFDLDGGPFTRLWLEENVLHAYRWDGGEYSINLETGKATPDEFTR